VDALSAWFDRPRRRRGRIAADPNDTILMIERLELRQMAAGADLLGEFTVKADAPVLPAEFAGEIAAVEVYRLSRENNVSESPRPESLIEHREECELIFLDEVADEIGAAFEIDEHENWWFDSE
jgi:hypothetical protein